VIAGFHHGPSIPESWSNHDQEIEERACDQ
jgi:hypothetical protein